MKFRNIIPTVLRTSAVRLTLRYVTVYGFIVATAAFVLMFFNWIQISSSDTESLKAELGLLVAEFRAHGREGLLKTVAARSKRLTGRKGARLYLFISETGEKLAGNMFAWPEEIDASIDSEVREEWIDEEVLPREIFEDDAYLPYITKKFPDHSTVFLAAVTPQAPLLQEVSEYLLESLGIGLVLSFAIGLTISSVILRRVGTISTAAFEIMEGDLSSRVPVSGRKDEFDLMAQRLNSMLDRIQKLVRGLKEVTDNVAHDLKSPLTRLKSQFEITLLKERGLPEYREAINQGLDEVSSLLRTFNALLNIAQIELGNNQSEGEEVSLRELLDELVLLYAPAAEDDGRTLELESEGSYVVLGSRPLISQAVSNLLDNALKYTPSGGTIVVKLTRHENRAVISVCDTGSGISPCNRERVLERFIRLENSRHTRGNGLGLSLVKAIAAFHDATLSLGDNNPGLVVSLSFKIYRDLSIKASTQIEKF